MHPLDGPLRSRSGRRALCCAALLLAAASCGGRSTPEERLCVEILARRSPAAQVLAIESAPEEQRAAITYRVKGSPVASELDCAFQANENGGLRVRSVAIDGEPLLEAELAVIDADLLFDDLGRGGAPMRR